MLYIVYYILYILTIASDVSDDVRNQHRTTDGAPTCGADQRRQTGGVPTNITDPTVTNKY